MSSPPSVSSTSTPSISRTRSRRGLSLSAVSPIVISPTRAPEQSPQRAERPPSMVAAKPISSCVEELPHDLEVMDIDHQLRLLAMKEMELVELKDRRRDIDQSITANERQLHRLRVVIQRSLYSQMSTPNQQPQSTPTPSRNGSLKRTTRRSPPTPNRPRTNSNPRDEAIMATRRRSGGVDERWSSFFDDPLRHRPEELVAQVSSSLWSFVSDMKQGMLSRLDEETTVVNNSDDDDDNSDEGDIQVDLSMYQAIRRKQESDHHPYVAY